MLQKAKQLIKYIIIATAIVATLFTIAVIYIVYNKETITDYYLQTFKTDTKVDFRYSAFKLNLLSHFPNAAFTFENPEIYYPGIKPAKALLTARQISFTINLANLLNKRFDMREGIVEGGTLHYIPQGIDSLLHHLKPETQQQNPKSNFPININKLRLENTILNIYSINSKLKHEVSIHKSQFDISIYNKNKYSFDIEVNSIRTNNKEYSYPMEISGSAEEDGNNHNIEIKRLKCNSVSLDAKAHYNQTTGKLNIAFNSGKTSIIRMMELAQGNQKWIQSGWVKFSGTATYNTKNNHTEQVILKHSSSLKIRMNKRIVTIDKMVGETQLTNNLKNHHTYISNISIKDKNSSIKANARVKGIETPIILTEGTFDINEDGIETGKNTISVKAKGNIKALVSVKNSGNDEKNPITFHKVKGNATYSVSGLDILKDLNEIEGTVNADNDLTLHANANLNGKPLSIHVIQQNIASCLNTKSLTRPEIAIESDELNVDYILASISRTEPDDTKNRNSDTYNARVKTKCLKVLNSRFMNVSGCIKYSNNEIEITDFVGNGFDGTINGTLKKLGNTLWLNTEFRNINITNLFAHYNNFNQSVVQSSNISGNLAGKAHLFFNITDKGTLDYPSLKLESEITISNGRLTGMNKIEKLSKWLRLNEVKSIDFSTIHNTVEISNQCVRFPQIQIKSNVVNFLISGEHHFDGNYNYWLKLNFNQILGRRFLKESAQNYSEDGGISLYLKLSGNKDAYEIGIDKKSSLEKIRNDLEQERKNLQTILREEFKPSHPTDSARIRAPKDSLSKKSSIFRVEWDEYDTLKTE